MCLVRVPETLEEKSWERNEKSLKVDNGGNLTNRGLSVKRGRLVSGKDFGLGS